MKTSKYVVIGGQYDCYTYGAAKTLTGAKRLASSHVEYWDNWQGWHYPDIFRVEDVEAVDTFSGLGLRAQARSRPRRNSPLGQPLGGDRMTALRTKWLDYHPSTGWQRIYRAAALRIIDAVSTEYAAPGATIAHLFLRYGAQTAINLDGGGSSEMWFNGSIVNRPSQGSERRLSDILYF